MTVMLEKKPAPNTLPATGFVVRELVYSPDFPLVPDEFIHEFASLAAADEHRQTRMETLLRQGGEARKWDVLDEIEVKMPTGEEVYLSLHGVSH